LHFGTGDAERRLHDYAICVYCHAVMAAFRPTASISNPSPARDIACASTPARP
jgi:hypothetical protein